MDSSLLKQDQLAAFVVPQTSATPLLTTSQGLRISDNHHSAFSGSSSSSVMQDYVMREKLASFGHERIPERVVNARGAGAHGVFRAYKPMTEYTSAAFLQNPEVLTPVFVRFSNMTGAQGSADTVRDVRGFAVKFYTSDGNFDLVGNNMPVFYVQDALKFPDLMHALKPEPDSGMPQASSGHDTFWDFASLMPETTHMLMWTMSSRGLPRSLRMMEGFGVHTFELINRRGDVQFVKFHWKPRLGVHALDRDEAQIIAGKDPEFYRRDLWQAIDSGHFPEWELGVQMLDASRVKDLGFDLMDPTKLIPESLAPVQWIGRLTLDRNPVNYFAETEQVAFHPGHVVPGISISNDPLLQGRLLSYGDSQRHRLGGANYSDLPINRSVCPFHNFQRDGQHRTAIHAGRVAYEPNMLGNGSEFRIDGNAQDFKVPVPASSSPALVICNSRSGNPDDTFGDHFSQAALFWESQSHSEKDHIVAAFRYELSKVAADIRQRVVDNLAHVDTKLAIRIAATLGIGMPDAKAATGRLGFSHHQRSNKIKSDFAHNASTTKITQLTMASATTIKTRKIAILVGDGVEPTAVRRMQQDLEAAGAVCTVLASHLGSVSTAGGRQMAVAQTFAVMPSVFFDGILIAGGIDSAAGLNASHEAAYFVMEAFRHGKTICAINEGAVLLSALGFLPDKNPDRIAQPAAGILFADIRKVLDGEVSAQFIQALAQHRHWERVTAPPASV